MSRRDRILVAVVVALCVAALTALALRPVDPLDRAGPDAIWRREAGR